MLRRVKMCTVQCQFDVMCASIVLEPKENEDDNAAPYNTFSWHGLSRPRLYVSIFPFHNPRLVAKFNQSTIAQPFEKKHAETSKKTIPSTSFFQSPTFFIWKFEKNPWLHGSSSNSVIFCGGAGGAMVRKNCAWRSDVIFVRACFNGRQMIITGDILYWFIFFMFIISIINQYCLNTRELFEREK